MEALTSLIDLLKTREERLYCKSETIDLFSDTKIVGSTVGGSFTSTISGASQLADIFLNSLTVFPAYPLLQEQTSMYRLESGVFRHQSNFHTDLVRMKLSFFGKFELNIGLTKALIKWRTMSIVVVVFEHCSWVPAKSLSENNISFS